MNKTILNLVLCASLLVAMVSAAQQTGVTQPLQLGPAQRGQLKTAYGKLPLIFEANQGQASPKAKFVARGQGYSAFLTAGGIVLSLRPATVAAPQTARADSNSPWQSANTVLQINLIGEAQNPAVVGEDQQPGHVNYFLGNNPKRWRTNVPTYGRVRYKNVYPGIDLVYYGNSQNFEYDFEVSGGANPNLIQFEIKGADQIQLDPQGNLIVGINGGELSLQSPVVYQQSKGQRLAVDGQYVMKDSTHVGFRVLQYDPSKPLVIDPVLVYSTYLGGSGTEYPTGIAVDSAGSVYVGGYTDSSDFPGALLGSLPAGIAHVFVAKLDATASNLIYADYIGGSSFDYGYALALDSTNNVYISGATQSTDFPIVNPYQGTDPGPSSAFLTKVSSDGSSLLYSTYLGGSGSEMVSGLAVDLAGEMIVAGYTSSTDFPVVNAYQPTAAPNQGGIYGEYGFLTKFSRDGASLAYSTYFAGSSNVALDCGTGTPCWPEPDSYINGMALDGAGNAYVAGNTNTYDFPVTSGAYLGTDTVQQDGGVGFVSKFNSSGSLDYSTYFYESSGALTNINAIAVDSSGSAYVTGMALSDGTFPLTSISICDPSVYGEGCSYGFITKFDPTGSTLSYSTYLGPNNFAQPAALQLDANNDAYVLATSWSSSYALVNAIEPYTNTTNFYDVLLAEIDPTATSQLWATYLGGSLDSYAANLTLDSSGNLFVLGSTDSTDFPTTQGAFQSVYGGGGLDAFILKIGMNSAASVAISPRSLVFATQQVGSTSRPQAALLRNMGSAALSISSISTTGDFAETDDCAPSVPAASSCNFSVTFTPTAAGMRSGSIVIQDNAAGSPHIVNLSGDGSGPAVSLTSSSLSFSSVPSGNSSAPQSLTLTNAGNVGLTISSVEATADFSETNNCGTVVAPGSSCTITVTFNPSGPGTHQGTLTINDNAPGNPQSLSLTGVGSDFSLSSTSSSEVANAGAVALYQLVVTPIGGSFSGTVNLGCSGLPANTTCNLTPNSVTPDGNQATVTLTLTTAAMAAQLFPAQRSRQPLVYAICLPLPGLGLFGVALPWPKHRIFKARFLAVVSLLTFLMLMAACARGSAIAPISKTGTPAGTYTVTVTGKCGSLQHSLPLTLTVQ